MLGSGQRVNSVAIAGCSRSSLDGDPYHTDPNSKRQRMCSYSKPDSVLNSPKLFESNAGLLKSVTLLKCLLKPRCKRHLEELNLGAWVLLGIGESQAGAAALNGAGAEKGEKGPPQAAWLSGCPAGSRLCLLGI